MAVCKIYTLDDLKATGLKVFDSCRYAGNEVEVGEIYLQGEVISQWDFSDYSNDYVFYDGIGETTIKEVVNVCKKIDDKTTKFKRLSKDLSNANGDEL